MKCDPAQFQRVCDSYFRDNGYPNIVSYGLTIDGIKTKKGTPDSHCVDKDGVFTFFEYTKRDKKNILIIAKENNGKITKEK